MDKEIFDQVLLSCEELCYSVAYALSGDQDNVRDLEREILKWVWDLLDSEDGRIEIKRRIIKVLHKRFMQDYRMNYEQFTKQNRPRKKEILRAARNA